MDALVQKRFPDEPCSTGVRVDPHPEVFQPLNQHGPLGLAYLHTFRELTTEHGSVRGTQNLLTRLYHEDNTQDGGRYLERPVRRLYRKAVNVSDTYANTKYADAYLRRKGLSHKKSVSLVENNYAHEHFLASITAAIDLGCRRDPNSEFLSEAMLAERIRSGTREMPCKISHTYKIWDPIKQTHFPRESSSSKGLLPDAYFAIRRTEQGRNMFRAYFLEVDRNTEPGSRSNLDEKSWLATLMKYIEVIDSGYYKSHFGITAGVMVLIVSTSPEQIELIQKILSHISDGEYKNYFLFRVWPEFANKFFVPKEVNYSLYDGYWQCCGMDPKKRKPRQPVRIWDLFSPTND